MEPAGVDEGRRIDAGRIDAATESGGGLGSGEGGKSDTHRHPDGDRDSDLHGDPDRYLHADPRFDVDGHFVPIGLRHPHGNADRLADQHSHAHTNGREPFRHTHTDCRGLVRFAHTDCHAHDRPAHTGCREPFRLTHCCAV